MVKSKSFKLGHERWQELADVTRGKALKDRARGRVLCDAVVEQVHECLEREYRRKPKREDPRRREWWMLDQMTFALLTDGGVLGVAINNPELIDPMRPICKRLGLTKMVALFDAITTLVPREVLRSKKYSVRERWYMDDANEKKRRTIERLSDRCELFWDGYHVPALQLILEAPASFFDDPHSHGFDIA